MRKNKISMEQFKDLFYDKKLPIKAICEITGLSAPGVHSFRMRNDLPKRGRSPFNPKRTMRPDHPFKKGFGKGRKAWNRKYPDFFECKECCCKIPNKTGHLKKFCSKKCHNVYASKNKNAAVFKGGELHWNYAKDRTSLVDRKKTRFTSRQQRLIAAKHNYICNICKTEFAYKKPFYKAKRHMSFDHIVPIRLGGEHSIENGQLLCRPCNKIKTTADHKNIISYRHTNSSNSTNYRT